MEAGKNMLQTGNQGWYPKSIGWPFILSIVFGIFGISNWVAIYTSILLGSLTVLNIFFLTFIISRRQNLSLISALIYSLFPINVVWSATAKTNIVSIFFTILTMFFCFLYYKKKKHSLLWLALIGLAFTSQFRLENYTLPLLFLFGCIIYHKKFFKNINFKFILPWFVLVILSMANLIQLIDFDVTYPKVMDDDVPGEKTRFSFDNLVYNSFHYGIYLFNSEFQPIIYTLLFIAGFIYMLRRQKKEAVFLITWFCLFWFVYFIPRFQYLGGVPILGKTRYFMIFYPVTVIFAVYGILLIKDFFSSKIKNSDINQWIFPLIVVILVISFIPHTTKASTWFGFEKLIIVQGLETKIPELAEKDIPPDCIIIAPMPIVLTSTTNLNVIDLGNFLVHKPLQKEIFNKTDCVLFFEDVYCLYFCCEYNRTSEEMENCKKIKNGYDLEPYKSYVESNMNYTFYKINSKEN